MTTTATPVRSQGQPIVEFRPLKQVCRFAYGDALKTEDRRDGPVKVYGSNGAIGYHDSANTSAPCLIIGRKGSFGKVTLSREPAFVIDTAYFVDPSTTRDDVHWLYYALSCAGLDAVSKDSAVPGLSRQDAYARMLPWCPPDQQAQIAKCLHSYDGQVAKLIRNKRRLIALLNEEKQAIIQQAVTRGLDPDVPMKPSGVEWLGEIPSHWGVKSLKHVLHKLIDCEHKTAPAVDSSEFLVVRTAAVRHGQLRLSGTYCTTADAFGEWTKRGRPEPGDVIFTREAPAGEACIVPVNLNVCLGQRTVLMKVRADAYDPRFLIHMLYSGPPARHIQLASQGSTVGHFNISDIGSLKILAPPLLEQIHIASAIASQTSGIVAAISSAEREIDLIREYRTRLIADVVTGQLDVRNVEIADDDLLLEQSEGLDLELLDENESNFDEDGDLPEGEGVE